MKAVFAFVFVALALFGLAFGKPLTDGTEEESFAVANEYEEQDIEHHQDCRKHLRMKKRPKMIQQLPAMITVS